MSPGNNEKPAICALLGSPRRQGNTALLLSRAVAGAREAGCTVTTVIVPSLEFSPCREIYFCRDNDRCKLQDGITGLYPLFASLDSLIIATPVMTMGVPGALKSFMDRFQVFYCAKYLRNSPLVAPEKRKYRNTLLISIAGMNLPDNFDGVRQSAQAFCDIIDCPLTDEILVRDMDGKKDLNRFPEILDEAYRKGRMLGEHVVAAVKK
ncbi:flavodoxin family protein [Methanoregula sp.]|uniref:flavodoxin family protein n=1 Tax=Methanoregula sp. TaxID=2052170 RepID=UPI002613EFAA|nr:flavodoxin family protein [Methanoregula sp.]MDD5143607.1 flavodoxin family protein [Methanoregula sp.]